MSATERHRATQRERTLALAAELYTKHHRRLLAIGTRNAPNPQDAEEALNDAFALFIDRFDPDSDAPPLAWITLTLKRRCWTYHRRDQLEQTTISTPKVPSQINQGTTTADQTTKLAALADDAKTLRHGLQTLKPQERKALTLLALGYSYREIGETYGWSYTKVNRCITEGRSRLRKLQAEPANPKTNNRPKGAKTRRS